MRICVLALALIAFAQPAFAKSSHRHAHVARAYHHGHHVAHARMRAPAAPAEMSFTRTNATDRPVFSDPSFQTRSDPSFPNRALTYNRARDVSWTQREANWSEGNWNQGWSQPSQSFGFGEPAPRLSGNAFAPRARVAAVRNTALDAMIARHAAANGLPVELVHRVVKRESGYNPRAASRGNLGLMQIRYQTARGVGYTGSAAGLLNPETNLTYAVKYLAGAYRAAGGNASRAVSYYASGYHGRGVAVARRARAVVAENTWVTSSQGDQPGWGMRTDSVAMRDGSVPVRRMHRRWRL